jgi:hypothetical protein
MARDRRYPLTLRALCGAPQAFWPRPEDVCDACGLIDEGRSQQLRWIEVAHRKPLEWARLPAHTSGTEAAPAEHSTAYVDPVRAAWAEQEHGHRLSLAVERTKGKTSQILALSRVLGSMGGLKASAGTPSHRGRPRSGGQRVSSLRTIGLSRFMDRGTRVGAEDERHLQPRARRGLWWPTLAH